MTTTTTWRILSLAAMEAELKPQVLETLDVIADTYKKLRKLQDAAGREPAAATDDAVAQPGAPLQEAQGRDRSPR